MTSAAAALVPPHDAAAPSALSMTPDELVAWLGKQGVPCTEAEARRLLAHLVSDGRSDFVQKKPVSARVREAVRGGLDFSRPDIVERVEDQADGFVKYLFRARDGALFEAVRIPLHKPAHFTVCLSSQVGCAMGCAFCATGRLGLTRNLTAAEIVGSFLAVRDEARAIGRVSGAVFMGQGEPLHNYDEVLRAAAVLSHPCGGRVDKKNISISTVGLVPQMLRYAREAHRFRLIVSLTSALADKRKALLPVAGAFALSDVAAAIRAVQESLGGRMTIAWVVLGGVNTGADEVTALQALLPDIPLRINLIDVNDARPVADGGFTRATPAELAGFLNQLQVLGAPLVRRYSGGQNRHAACGMLASHRLAEDAAGS